VRQVQVIADCAPVYVFDSGGLAHGNILFIPAIKITLDGLRSTAVQNGNNHRNCNGHAQFKWRMCRVPRVVRCNLLGRKYVAVHHVLGIAFSANACSR